ncbi:MAG: DUF3078 domain-containing protein [Bacteroidota bacterium]
MKNIFPFFCFLFLTVHVDAQTQSTPPPAPEYGWKHTLMTALTINQVAFTDWVQGGTNSLSWGASADGKSVNEMETLQWSNGYRFAFGQVRLGDQGTKKTDDKIDLETILIYKTVGCIQPFVAATLKTQFAPGYSYDANNVRTQVSAFFDPAELVQSTGVEYQPAKEVKTRLGLALREVLTSKFTRYADDPKTTTIEKTSVRGGLESATNVEFLIDDNVLFTTQLELFSAFKNLDEVIVRTNSSIMAKVGKYITVVLNLQLINERQITPRTQAKQTLGLGVSYRLF